VAIGRNAPLSLVTGRRAEHHVVGQVVSVGCRNGHRIAGVSAVPDHRQPVLTNLSKYDSYSNNNMSII